LEKWPDLDLSNQDRSTSNETNISSNALQENNSTKYQLNKSNRTQDQPFEDLSIDPIEQLNSAETSHLTRDTSNNVKSCIYQSILTLKPLIMATRENVESNTSLMGLVNKLSQLKRNVDKVESDLRNLRRQKESLMGPTQKTVIEESHEVESKLILIENEAPPSETQVDLPASTQLQLQ
jgi:hypothetical protein